MGKKLKFGGPNLPEGTHTWYDHRNPDGKYGGQVQAYPGDVVDADRVGGPIEDERGIVFMGYGPEYYVNAGSAVLIDDAAEVPVEEE